MKKALKFRQERFKDVNLKINQNINISKMNKGQRKILEKGLLEEWTIEGKKQNLSNNVEATQSHDNLSIDH